MKWLKESAWQLGLGVLLAGAGAVIMYKSAMEGNQSGTWAGLVIFFAAMSIPLFRKVFQAGGEED